VGDQRAFRGAGGAARVDQHGAIVGARLDARKARAEAIEFAAPVEVCPQRGGTDADQRAQCRALRADREQVGDRALVADRDHRLAVAQPVLQRVGPEQHRQGHRDRAHLQHRHVGDGRLESLRHHDRHALAAAHPELHQRVTESVGGILERAVRERVRGGRRAVGADRDALLRIRLARPAGAAGVGDVEVRRHLPAEARVHARVVVAALTDAHRRGSL
jgi:hypothetical protein